jgi:hypothetical protein
MRYSSARGVNTAYAYCRLLRTCKIGARTTSTADAQNKNQMNHLLFAKISVPVPSALRNRPPPSPQHPPRSPWIERYWLPACEPLLARHQRPDSCCSPSTGGLTAAARLHSAAQNAAGGNQPWMLRRSVSRQRKRATKSGADPSLEKNAREDERPGRGCSNVGVTQGTEARLSSFCRLRYLLSSLKSNSEYQSRQQGKSFLAYLVVFNTQTTPCLVPIFPDKPFPPPRRANFKIFPLTGAHVH